MTSLLYDAPFPGNPREYPHKPYIVRIYRVIALHRRAVPPSHPQKFFCFVISKWHILVNSEVLNLKFFFSQKL